MAAMFVAALCFSACDHENGEENENNQENTPSTNLIPNAVQDIDGNCYDAVRIGDQVWMAENLRTTRYADGTAIPLGSENEYEEPSYDQPFRYYPNNADSNVNNYGYLYNWPAVMHDESSSDANPSGVQGICPNGWHVPSDAEWSQLVTHLRSDSMYWGGGNSNDIAKAIAATWGWDIPSHEDWSSSFAYMPGNNPETNNISGFSAVPAGCYVGDGYHFFGERASFWSSTEIYNINVFTYSIYHDFFDIEHLMYGKQTGMTVRCLQN